MHKIGLKLELEKLQFSLFHLHVHLIYIACELSVL